MKRTVKGKIAVTGEFELSGTGCRHIGYRVHRAEQPTRAVPLRTRCYRGGCARGQKERFFAHRFARDPTINEIAKKFL
jgi:hypothetical protein